MARSFPIRCITWIRHWMICQCLLSIASGICTSSPISRTFTSRASWRNSSMICTAENYIWSSIMVHNHLIRQLSHRLNHRRIHRRIHRRNHRRNLRANIKPNIHPNLTSNRTRMKLTEQRPSIQPLSNWHRPTNGTHCFGTNFDLFCIVFSYEQAIPTENRSVSWLLDPLSLF